VLSGKDEDKEQLIKTFFITLYNNSQHTLNVTQAVSTSDQLRT